MEKKTALMTSEQHIEELEKLSKDKAPWNRVHIGRLFMEYHHGGQVHVYLDKGKEGEALVWFGKAARGNGGAARRKLITAAIRYAKRNLGGYVPDEPAEHTEDDAR